MPAWRALRQQKRNQQGESSFRLRGAIKRGERILLAQIESYEAWWGRPIDYQLLFQSLAAYQFGCIELTARENSILDAIPLTEAYIT